MGAAEAAETGQDAMDGLRRIGDLFIWFGQSFFAMAPARAPRRALGMIEGRPTLLAREGESFKAERPARAGDAAPLFLNGDQALTLRIEVAPGASLHGAGPARLEAARRCPFPLDEARWSLTRAPEAWSDGAPWRFVAAPRNRLTALEEALREAGARPGPAFAMVGGAAQPLAPRPPVLVIAAACLMLCALGGALVSVSLGAARIEVAAEERLTAARADLDAAETGAASAATARDDAAAPLRAAAAGRALLLSAPPAAAALARLTEATPDDAHAARLSVGPGRIEGEFIAPDAAALATTLAAAPHFVSARLRTAARAEAAGGQQRATIEIIPAATRE